MKTAFRKRDDLGHQFRNKEMVNVLDEIPPLGILVWHEGLNSHFIEPAVQPPLKTTFQQSSPSLADLWESNLTKHSNDGLFAYKRKNGKTLDFFWSVTKLQETSKAVEHSTSK